MKVPFFTKGDEFFGSPLLCRNCVFAKDVCVNENSIHYREIPTPYSGCGQGIPTIDNTKIFGSDDHV